jgi:hypothetical protein
MDSASNPADLITRGTTPRHILTSIWLNGPPFLKDDHIQEKENHSYLLNEDDPEICSSAYSVTSSRGCFGAERFTRFSSWSSLSRAIANLILKIERFKKKKRFSIKVSNCDVSVKELKKAEVLLIRNVH